MEDSRLQETFRAGQGRNEESIRATPRFVRRPSGLTLTSQSLGELFFASIVRSAPSSAASLRRLLTAFGLPSSPAAVQAAVDAHLLHWMALEMLEISEISSDSGAQGLRRAMLERVERRQVEGSPGARPWDSLREIVDELDGVARRGDNAYHRAAELLFSHLSVSGKPRKPLPRGTWLELWSQEFLMNTRIARTLLQSFVEQGDRWVQEFVWLYEPIHSDNTKYRVDVAPSGSEGLNVSHNPVVLAGLQVQDQWVARPSLLGGGKATSTRRMPMSIIDHELATAVQERISTHKGNLRYVEMIFSAIDGFNFSLITGPDLFPDTSVPGDRETLAESRGSVLRQAKLGDTLLTATPRRGLSRTIARLDGGSWSHLLGVLEKGRVLDARPEGIVEAAMDDYLTGEYRFALCRPHSLTVLPHDRERWATEAIRESARLQEGKRYGWLGALRAAFTSWLYLQVPDGKHSTPNAVAFRGGMQPLVVW